MKMLEDFGKGTTEFIEYAGGLTQLFGESLRFIGQFRIRMRDTMNQAYLLGVGSIVIVLLTSLFTGMVTSLESAVQAVHYGVASFVGGAVGFTMSRELGPMLSAVVVAGRTGAAIAAELGSMVVTEQVEALYALGLSPVRVLVVPRLLALVLTLPILTLLAEIVGMAGAQWVAQSVAHIGYAEFMDSVKQAIGMEDVFKGLFKSLIFAIIIAIVGAYQGLGTRGGAAGVGKATTGAVVIAIILIFASNFVLSYMLFGTS